MYGKSTLQLMKKGADEMHETYRDRKKAVMSKSIMVFDNVDELISDAIPEPIIYFKEGNL